LVNLRDCQPVSDAIYGDDVEQSQFEINTIRKSSFPYQSALQLKAGSQPSVMTVFDHSAFEHCRHSPGCRKVVFGGGATEEYFYRHALKPSLYRSEMAPHN
jgi:hypothetical protein